MARTTCRGGAHSCVHRRGCGDTLPASRFDVRTSPRVGSGTCRLHAYYVTRLLAGHCAAAAPPPRPPLTVAACPERFASAFTSVAAAERRGPPAAAAAPSPVERLTVRDAEGCWVLSPSSWHMSFSTSWAARRHHPVDACRGLGRRVSGLPTAQHVAPQLRCRGRPQRKGGVVFPFLRRIVPSSAAGPRAESLPWGPAAHAPVQPSTKTSMGAPPESHPFLPSSCGGR